MHAIDLQGISKSYQGKKVLTDISLSLEQGHFYVLIGQNGAGKSTLMRIIVRQEAPTAGDGIVMGLRLSNDDRDFNLLVGFASEGSQLPTIVPVKKTIETLSRLYPKWDANMFAALGEEFGVDLNSKYSSLSRGQKMQVYLSFLLAKRPKLLVLDEVTAVLDARARAIAIRLCKEFIKDGGTVVMSTNIVSEVQPVAEHLVYLEGTKLKMLADVRELAKKFIKLRRPQGFSHPVFAKRECVELRLGSDDSSVWLLPAEDTREPISDDLKCPGEVTVEDVFIYFSQLSARAQK